MDQRRPGQPSHETNSNTVRVVLLGIVVVVLAIGVIALIAQG